MVNIRDHTRDFSVMLMALIYISSSPSHPSLTLAFDNLNKLKTAV